MEDSELIHYILEGREGGRPLFPESWFRKSPGFRDFVCRYRDKIRGKFRAAETKAQVLDIRAELEFAYLVLLDDRFDVEYEKYGAGKVRSPDFAVVFEGAIAFNAEVKHIRESGLSTRFEKLVADVGAGVQKVKSGLDFGIEPGVAGVTRDLLDRAEQSKAGVIDFIIATVQREESKLVPDKQYEYAIPGFDRDLILFLVKHSWKDAPGPTSHDGIMPIPYSHKEYRKLGDAIFEKLGQLVPGMINVLVIFCSSFTHEEVDLLKAVDRINERLARGDDAFFVRKGLAHRHDFLDHVRRLSGILFRDSYVPVWPPPQERNFLWQNSQAECEVPEPISQYLRVMDDR